MELLETFRDSALQCDYNPWESVDVHGYGKIRADLEKSFKAVRVASDVESSASLSEPVFVSERLPSSVVVLHSVHELTLVKLIIVVLLSCWLGNCDPSAKLPMQNRLDF